MADEENSELSPEAMEELTAHLNKAAMVELFQQYHEMYVNFKAGGFTEAEARALVVEILWKFMQEGSP